VQHFVYSIGISTGCTMVHKYHKLDKTKEIQQMELFIFFAIAALGGFWWVNHVMKKKTDALFQQELKKDEPQVPYKVEAPAEVAETTVKEITPEPTKCGCGRSPSGYCVGLHKLSAEEWSKHSDNPNKTIAPPVEVVPAEAVKPKRPRKPAAKPAAKKTTAKKPASAAKKVKK
jgi:hypothetical protein